MRCCECDIATPIETGEEMVTVMLEQLLSLDIVKRRNVNGMNYYTFVDAALIEFLRRKLSGVEHP